MKTSVDRFEEISARTLPFDIYPRTKTASLEHLIAVPNVPARLNIPFDTGVTKFQILL
jgi:hypothetical protein